RFLAAQRQFQRLSRRAVAAPQPVGPKLENLPKSAVRGGRRLRNRILADVLEPSSLQIGQYLVDLLLVEPGGGQVGVFGLELLEHAAWRGAIPLGGLGGPVVCQSQQLSLGGVDVQIADRDRIDPELQRGAQPGVPGDDLAVRLARDDRRAEAEAADRLGHLLYSRIVLARVLRPRLQLLQRHPLRGWFCWSHAACASSYASRFSMLSTRSGAMVRSCSKVTTAAN